MKIKICDETIIKVKEIVPGEVCELNGDFYMRFTNSPEILYCDGANIPMIDVKTGRPALVSRDVLVRPVYAVIVVK